MKLHGYLKDHTVIQANEECIVQGKGSPASPVLVRIGYDENVREFTAVSNETGNFFVSCGKYEPSFTEYKITVSCKEETVTISHILFGDVYLALGQSNIELRLKYLQNYENLIAEYGKERFRFLDIDNVFVNYNGKGIYGLSEESTDFCGDFRWGDSADNDCAADTFGFSYVFCGELQRRTGYPVAMVNLAVGGSTFANWLPRETVQAHPLLSSAYANSLLFSENGQSNAGCIYYEKLCPLKGFAFKGGIWYLGESMAWDGFDSTSTILPAMKALTDLYRKELRGGLPMVVMDIGIQSYGTFSVNYANEQFGLACSQIENLVECPLFDLPHAWIRPDGNEMYHPIHLVEKQEHARRAAMLFYENFIAGNRLRCPTITDITYRDFGAICKIDAAGSLKTRDNKQIYGFALAGDDGKYVTAQAKITEKNTIEVSSPWIEKPARLLYGFFPYNNNCNIVSGNLPLLPYRSRFENADALDYAVFNPAFFCRYETIYENAFSAFGGGAGFKRAHTAGKLFGNQKVGIAYSDDGVTLSMRYCPEDACFAGISPEILICDQPHHLNRYDRMCLELTPEKELEFTGIHFRTCEGEQFYLVPVVNGEEMRNLRLEGGKRKKLIFDLHSAVNRMERTFLLTEEKRKQIAVMQITFRNRERDNSVTIHDMTCYYEKLTEAVRGEDNKDKMYRYG